MSRHIRYYGNHEGQSIVLATLKQKTLTVALVVQVQGVKGVTLVDGFETERKARNWAKREGYDTRYGCIYIPISTTKPE